MRRIRGSGVPVVSNSSPLIALARIQRLDLIPTILESSIRPALDQLLEGSLFFSQQLYDELLCLAAEYMTHDTAII
jgi:predicted nucleic acid-binding protein